MKTLIINANHENEEDLHSRCAKIWIHYFLFPDKYGQAIRSNFGFAYDTIPLFTGNGGEGGNRTRAYRFCKPVHYHFATSPGTFLQWNTEYKRYSVSVN